MCSSSVTELSLSHAGLRQDYKRWTAMCSKSSYLPSLEGMPCKILIGSALRSVDRLCRVPLFPSAAALTVTCWLQHVPDPQPRQHRGSLVASWGPGALRWHVQHTRGIWLGAERSNRSQAKASRARSLFITADGGSVAFNIKTDATSLFHLSGNLDVGQNELSA